MGAVHAEALEDHLVVGKDAEGDEAAVALGIFHADVAHEAVVGAIEGVDELGADLGGGAAGPGGLVDDDGGGFEAFVVGVGAGGAQGGEVGEVEVFILQGGDGEVLEDVELGGGAVAVAIQGAEHFDLHVAGPGGGEADGLVFGLFLFGGGVGIFFGEFAGDDGVGEFSGVTAKVDLVAFDGAVAEVLAGEVAEAVDGGEAAEVDGDGVGVGVFGVFFAVVGVPDGFGGAVEGVSDAGAALFGIAGDGEFGFVEFVGDFGDGIGCGGGDLVGGVVGEVEVYALGGGAGCELDVEDAVAIIGVVVPALAGVGVGGLEVVGGGEVEELLAVEEDVFGWGAGVDGEGVGAVVGFAGVVAEGGVEGEGDVAKGAFLGGGAGDGLEGVLALFVGAGEAVVFIQGEGGFAVGVDVESEGVFGALVVVEHFGVHGDDGAGSYEDGEGLEGDGVGIDGGGAGGAAAVVIINPGAFGEVDAAFAPAAVDFHAGVDGGDEELAAEHELVLGGFIPGFGIVGVVPEEGAGDGCAGIVGVAAVGVDEGGEAHFELEVIAVDAAVGFGVGPGGFVEVAPTVHDVECGGEAFPLEVAGVGFGGAAEDAVDIGRGVGLAGEAGPGDGGDVVADEIPGAVLVAGPADAVALGAGPTLDGPNEAAGIGVGFEGGVGDAVAFEGVLVGGAGPGDVELLDAGSGGADFPIGEVECAFGPEAGVEAEAGEGFDGIGELHVAAAVAIVYEEPAAGHIVLAVGLGHGNGIGGDFNVGAIFPLFGVFGGFVAGHVGIGIAEFEAPDGEEVGAAGELGVEVDDAVEGGAHEVEGVEAVFFVFEGDFGVVGKIVGALCEGVAEGAVAGVAHVEGGGVGVAAFIPFAIGADFDFGAFVGEVAVLLAAAVVIFGGGGGEDLGGEVGGEVEGGELLPDGFAVGIGEGEAAGGFIEGEGEGGGGEGGGFGVIGEDHAGSIFALIYEDLGFFGVVFGIGEIAPRCGENAEHIGAEKLHAQLDFALCGDFEGFGDAALGHHFDDFSGFGGCDGGAGEEEGGEEGMAVHDFFLSCRNRCV